MSLSEDTTNCGACKDFIFSETTNCLKCRSCKEAYHSECLNINKEHFSSFSTDFISSWRCPACTNITRRAGSNLNTPVRSSQISQVDNSTDSMEVSFVNRESPAPAPRSRPVTEADFDSFSRSLFCKLQEWRNDLNDNYSSLREEIKTSLIDIRNEIKSIKSDQSKLDENVSMLSLDLSQLKTSVDFCSNEHHDIKKRLDDISIRNGDASPAILSLEQKIDSLEQQARQCNLEICNVPEKRSECLPTLVEEISSALNIPIPSCDIVSIHRVPHAQGSNSKPKNIIVKFTTRTLRDNVLSAYRRAKGLKSSQIGVAGTPVKIYFNEHLTLKKKHLFRLCREAARKQNYRYVWIKNSSILVRERDDKPAFIIRSESDLDKIKSNTK